MTCLELTVQTSDESSESEILADHFPFCLGRSFRNDLPLPYRSVSDRHLIINSADEETLSVTDAGSTNGTYVDDRRLPVDRQVNVELPVRLRLGDVYVTIRHAAGERSGFTMAQSSTQLRQLVDEAVHQSDVDDGSRPFIEILSGPDTGRRLSLQPEGSPQTIGSVSETDLHLDITGFPGEIATLFWRDGGFWIAPDAAGIQLGDAPIEEHRRLRSGDRFSIGPVELLFFDPLEQQLQVLEPGMHQRPPRRSNASTTPPPSTESAPRMDDEESLNDNLSPTSEDDPLEALEDATKKPADGSDKATSAAGLGVVELMLLVVSLVSLIGTVLLVTIFFMP